MTELPCFNPFLTSLERKELMDEENQKLMRTLSAGNERRSPERMSESLEKTSFPEPTTLGQKIEILKRKQENHERILREIKESEERAITRTIEMRLSRIESILSKLLNINLDEMHPILQEAKVIRQLSNAQCSPSKNNTKDFSHKAKTSDLEGNGLAERLSQMEKPQSLRSGSPTKCSRKEETTLSKKAETGFELSSERARTRTPNRKAEVTRGFMEDAKEKEETDEETKVEREELRKDKERLEAIVRELPLLSGNQTPFKKPKEEIQAIDLSDNPLPDDFFKNSLKKDAQREIYKEEIEQLSGLMVRANLTDQALRDLVFMNGLESHQKEKEEPEEPVVVLETLVSQLKDGDDQSIGDEIVQSPVEELKSLIQSGAELKKIIEAMNKSGKFSSHKAMGKTRMIWMRWHESR